MVRFIFGLAFGSAVGAAIVVLVTPHSGKELVATIRSELSSAIAEANTVAERHEQELWGEFYDRLKKRAQAAEQLV